MQPTDKVELVNVQIPVWNGPD